MLRIMILIGTRPECIKMLSLIKEMKRHQDKIQLIVCITAQHRKMLDDILLEFSIIPDFDLEVMEPNQTLSSLTSRLFEKIDKVIIQTIPDIVIVQGDTTTAFVGAICAFYNNCQIAHVEAGLRSFDNLRPFPEEANRKMISAVANLNFAPSEISRQNLINEGVSESKIYITGNTGIDALKYTVKNDYVFENETLKKIDFKKNYVILVTAHRRENWQSEIQNICTSLKTIVNTQKNVQIIWPVHPNPVVKKTVFDSVFGIKNINLIEPVDPICMHNLINKSFFVMTDSGGIQEEAPFLNKPVLILRDKTERPEVIQMGNGKLVGTSVDSIIKEASLLLRSQSEYQKMAKKSSPYGDGDAAEKILKIIIDKYYN